MLVDLRTLEDKDAFDQEAWLVATMTYVHVQYFESD